QRVDGCDGHKTDRESRGPREPHAVAAPDANAELAASMQRRHDRANSKSRSEYFNRNKDDTATGFPIEQSRLSHYKKEVGNGLELHPPMRESYSGPLVAGTWTKLGKKYDEISITSRANLSSLSGLVSSRTLLADDRDKRVHSQYGSTNQRGRLSEFSQDFGNSRIHDRSDLSGRMVGPRRIESGRSSAKELVMNDHGYKGDKKIHFSGPLGAANVDQMLKDHDRHIQEAARRARLDKTRLTKVESEALTNPIYMSSRRAR
ncbi:hypothetical protein Tco_1267962, partial [Tanacetum coccineum]